jgi:hypothetical protein
MIHEDVDKKSHLCLFVSTVNYTTHLQLVLSFVVLAISLPYMMDATSFKSGFIFHV